MLLFNIEKKIKPELFNDLSNVLVNEFYTDNKEGVHLWNGFRLLSPLKTGEGKLAIQHLLHVKENDLVIYDRGYPSFNLIYEHLKLRSNFLMRVKVGFSNVTKEFIRSGKTTQVVNFYPSQRISHVDKEYDKKTSVKVRLIRV